MDRKTLVGQKIRRLRQLRRLSQEALADSLNVAPYEMLYFDNGELVRQLRTRATKLIDEVPDEDIPRVVGLLEAVLHGDVREGLRIVGQRQIITIRSQTQIPLPKPTRGA